LFAGGQGTLKRSTDGGVTWVDLPLGAPADAVLAYIAVGPGDSRVVYAGSYQTGIYKSSDAGNTWSAVKAPSK